MQDKKRKIIVEFSMCEPEKAALANYLTNHLDELNSRDYVVRRSAMEGLKDSLRENLPPAAQDGLKTTLTSDSEYAWLMHNLPENEAIDFRNTPANSDRYKQNMFSFHIGNALYEMHNLEPSISSARHRDNPNWLGTPGEERLLNGTFAHRHFTAFDPLSSGKPTGFSSLAVPFNDEAAPTDLFFMEDALHNIPREIRERTKAFVEYKQLLSWDEEAPPTILTLQQILENLEDPALRDKETITCIDPRNCDLPFQNRQEDIDLFNREMVAVADRCTLDKGDLLIWCEDKIFHQGFSGKPEVIENIPAEQRYSRSLLHNPAAPAPNQAR